MRALARHLRHHSTSNFPAVIIGYGLSFLSWAPGSRHLVSLPSPPTSLWSWAATGLLWAFVSISEDYNEDEK